MSKVFKHFKVHIFRGLLAAIPLILSYFVVRFIYNTVDRRVAGLIEDFVGRRIPGLGIVLVLLLFYLLGLLASNWMGRKAFNVIERITTKIPLVKTIYLLGKQVAEALSMPEKQAFKRAVLVEQFRPGLWSIAFVTGTVVDRENRGEKLLKLFIPTAPNPTSGFMVMVKESQVRSLGWEVSEAVNAILSGGMIGPKEIE